MALTVKLIKASQNAKGACEAFRVEDSNDNSTLEISLRRTVRVPDNGSSYSLPPDLGAFPIYNVLDYQARLPSSLVKKGVTFIPIYRMSTPTILHSDGLTESTEREAMWINFKAKGLFANQIYVGGVNAVSGEPKIESFSTLLRRKQLLSQGKSIQDYVTPPVQYVSHSSSLRLCVANHHYLSPLPFHDSTCLSFQSSFSAIIKCVLGNANSFVSSGPMGLLNRTGK